MTADGNITSIIRSSRKESGDGSMVIYNLTKGVDFSEPRKVAEALARVFFEMDASKWFSVNGDHIEFKPGFKVKILMQDEHSKLLQKTVSDFLLDLKNDELNREFAHQIKDISTDEEKARTASGFAQISMLLNHSFFKKWDNTEIGDQLFTEILEVLEISTPSDEDLIDWENLPI